MNLLDTYNQLKPLVVAEKVSNVINIRTFDEINEECEEKVLDGFGFVVYTEWGSFSSTTFRFSISNGHLIIRLKSDHDDFGVFDIID